MDIGLHPLKIKWIFGLRLHRKDNPYDGQKPYTLKLKW